MTQLPLAVVIPAYNRARLLAQALESVARQAPYQPTEIIVVDDCSQDDTEATALGHGARVIRHEVNKGPSAARNTGIRAATQPWVALLDCDDDWLPNHLQTVWDARGEHLLVAGSSIAWDPDLAAPTRLLGPLTRRPRVLTRAEPLLFPENFIVESGVLLRRDITLELGGYEESWRHSEDLHLWARLLARGSGVVLPDVTARYRVHPQQAVHARDKMRESHLAVLADADGNNGNDPGLEDRVMTVAHWDEFRLAQRERNWREAATHCAWFLKPRRLAALFQLLLWRFRSRRGARQFDVQGKRLPRRSWLR